MWTVCRQGANLAKLVRNLQRKPERRRRVGDQWSKDTQQCQIRKITVLCYDFAANKFNSIFIFQLCMAYRGAMANRIQVRYQVGSGSIIARNIGVTMVTQSTTTAPLTAALLLENYGTWKYDCFDLLEMVQTQVCTDNTALLRVDD